MEDLLAACPALRQQASRGEVACGVNVKYLWPGSQKQKTIDLAIGRPPRAERSEPQSGTGIVRRKEMAEVPYAANELTAQPLPGGRGSVTEFEPLTEPRA
jgi:hypothetical protein